MISINLNEFLTAKRSKIVKIPESKSFRLLSFDGILIAETANENEQGKKVMKRAKIIQKTILLNLVSHQFVTWTLIKISGAYRYAGLIS